MRLQSGRGRPRRLSPIAHRPGYTAATAATPLTPTQRRTRAASHLYRECVCVLGRQQCSCCTGKQTSPFIPPRPRCALQIYDVDIDAINKPFLPVASGELSPGVAWALCLAMAAGEPA